MMRARVLGTVRLLMVTAAVSATLGVAAQGLAVTVPGPEPIVSYNFESESASDTFPSIGPSAKPFIGDLATTAYWGRTSLSRNSGSFSLWCAGTDAMTDTASTFWPAYPEEPAGTRR